MGKKGTGSIKRFGGLLLVALLTITVVFAPRADAADKYWVCGGSGSWSDPDCWSLIDGGSGGAGFPVDGDVGYLSGAGGAILATTETIGLSSGTTVFNQSGGTNTLSGILHLGYYADSKGTYNLSAGSLPQLYLGAHHI